MNIRLYRILEETTHAFRKGELVENRGSVMEMFMMPHVSKAPANLEKIDMVFCVIGVDKEKAKIYKTELIHILNDWPNKSLRDGPSYIAVGADIGSQSAAFRLFALGKVLGLWDIITPYTFHLTDEDEARDMAGKGFIMMSGYKGKAKE